jgi:hypothetical protein
MSSIKMKHFMKQKVINVTYRKDSETFPKWMKYEIEILNEDGTTQTIPAYGKDLQDALSRVVTQKRVKTIEKHTEKVPMAVWLLLWFTYLGILAIGWMETQNHWIFVGGMLGAVAVILSLNWFPRLKNVDMKE